MEKIFSRLYIIFFVIACLIIIMYAISCIGYNSEKMFPAPKREYISPISEEINSDGSYTGEFSGTNIFEAGGCLAFSTSFMNVWVYSSDEIIYKSIGSNRLFMKSNGNVWHFIKVSENDKSIKVKIYPTYEEDNVTVPDFYVGEYHDLKIGIMRLSLVAFIISILDILCGIISLIYFSNEKEYRWINPNMMNFGITAIFLGIWSAGETNFMVIMVNNRALAAVIAFLILIFIPIPYVIYVHGELWKQDIRIYKIPICISLVDFIVVVALAVTDTMDLKQSVIFTHLTWGVSLIYVSVAIVNVLKNHLYKKDKMILVNTYSMLFLVGIAIFEIIYFWCGYKTSNDILGHTLVLGYFGVLLFFKVRDALENQKKAVLAEYYEKLANTDSNTGLSNRTAFNRDIELIDNVDEYCVISLDLNNLKKVNDTKGHQAGDRYIKYAADIIQNVFGEAGKCYRIGGDEFAVIIEKEDSEVVAEKLTAKMEEALEMQNKENPTESVIIAWGYEAKSAGDSRGFQQILYLADEKMYENKRFKKSLG